MISGINQRQSRLLFVAFITARKLEGAAHRNIFLPLLLSNISVRCTLDIILQPHLYKD